MRCYYETLGVRSDVSDEELKKAYRRMALQFHPDKNLDNEEEANKRFQEIQKAYEILSDPHQRAFYDRNKENILCGKEFGSGRKEDTLDVSKYCNVSCFSGYDDGDRGFYTVFRQVFESVSAKDMVYMEDNFQIPSFGNSQSDFQVITMFYGYWQSYCTSMTFFWADKYDVREAPNRWSERKIDKENKKYRDQARKKFNEEIRNLVELVRKKDKRWKAWKKVLGEKQEENQRKQMEKQEQQRKERMQLMEEAVLQQKRDLSQFENQLKEMESQFSEEWGTLDHEDSSCDDEDNINLAKEFYCIVCEKLFKSQKAYKNHEQSRKHNEKKLILTAEMQEDDQHINFKPELCEILQNNITASSTDINIGPSRRKKKEMRKKRKSEQNSIISTEVSCNDEDHPVINAEDESNLEVDERKKTRERRSTTEVDETMELPKRTPREKMKGKAKGTKKHIQEKLDKNICSVCKAEFTSSNKLFTHLRIEGHAAIKSTENR